MNRDEVPRDTLLWRQKDCTDFISVDGFNEVIMGIRNLFFLYFRFTKVYIEADLEKDVVIVCSEDLAGISRRLVDMGVTFSP